MNLVLAGISHRTAPLAVRERLIISADDNARLRDETKASEVLVLSTCNRSEIYARDAAPDAVRKALVRGAAPPAESVYLLENDLAVRHLFRVCASLDSLILGENQILGQVLAAEESAINAGTAVGLLRRLFSAARRCGKNVRSRTRIGEGAVSVASIALELAGKIFGSLNGRRVILLGSGEMASAAVEHLRGQGAVVAVTAHSRLERATAVAEVVGGEAVSFSDLARVLPSADIVLCSTASPEPVLSAATVRQAMRGRVDPLLVLDIAVPRDVEHAVRDLDNVYLFDMDGFEEIAEQRRAARRGEMIRAEEIVEEDLEAFIRWAGSRGAATVITSLQAHAESIRGDVWQEMESLLNGAPQESREKMEYLSKLLVKKLLHAPVTAVKSDDVAFPAEERAAALRLLFGLERES